MVHKFGTLADLHSFPSIDSEIENVITSNLKILEDNYGADRDIDKDDGGYVLYADSKASHEEIIALFNYKEYKPEYIDYIESTPPYCATLYLLSNDFGVVLFTTLNYTLKEICQNDMQD